MQALKNEEDGWLVPRQELPRPVQGKGCFSSYLIIQEAFLTTITYGSHVG